MEATAYPNREPLWVSQLPVAEDGTQRIRSVLVANRGEIACRVIATCHKLNIKSIAIYADEDLASRHIRDADEAVSLGSMDRPQGNPFLDISLLVGVAKRAGADAVHPGYGYLSENAQFADAVRAAGLIFIGPTSTAITTLGDKREAKEYLAKHAPHIPLIPGYTGSAQSGGGGVQLADLERESNKIGFPVMIKASAGGGGRGLRVVREASALAAELERAKSEAQRSFGLADCILEKYIEAGKHVEVQILGDSHGRVVSLWERDCSVQRRHQKVVEETPCAWLSQSKREAMCAAAVSIGELLGYEGAGTVEFILDVVTGNFYFLEVNARLQVEHPITEECTGLDLVALQLFVASGGSLATLRRLDVVPQNGHAIECRLCAEDPLRDFAPQHGTVRLWKPWSAPGENNAVRFETAVESGAKVSIYFDSMIAKIVVWAPSRTIAIDKMVQTLANSVCLGITTNQLFLQACLLHPGFRQRLDYTTSFIPTHVETLLQNPHRAAIAHLSRGQLSVVPCLFRRHVHKQVGVAGGGRVVFSSIPSGFRNQRFDRVNQPCDIVCTFDAKQGHGIDPHVCIWGSNGHVAKVAPLPTAAPDPKDAGSSDSPDAAAPESSSAIVTRAHNVLSRSLRSGALPGSATLDVLVHAVDDYTANGSGGVGRIEVSINQRKLVAYVAVGSASQSRTPSEPDTGDAVRVYCHIPLLGGPLEFHCFSVLSYFESQRLAIDSSAKANAADTLHAPMPCKVLQLLKKNGDPVKTGEIVMVIESMKMEISMYAEKAGAFQCSLSEGDAVQEGSVLCQFK